METAPAPRRFLFVCGSLEPGIDPVADHVWRLAQALRERGHPVGLLALNDPHFSGSWRDREAILAGLPIQRLGSDVRWRLRVHQAARFVGNLAPDWISLHYTPSAYHRWGLPLGLASRLDRIGGGRRWHLMFHELWWGVGSKVPAHHRLLGILQRQHVRHLLNRLRPGRVHTPARIYVDALQRLAVESIQLPLFASLPTPDRAPPCAGLPHERPDRVLRAGVFGPIPKHWDPITPLLQLADWAVAHNCRFEFWLVGHSGEHAGSLRADIQGALNDSIRIVQTGPIPPADAARAIAGLDVAFATAPWPLIERSSAAIDCLDLGVPVVVTGNGKRHTRSRGEPLDGSRWLHLHPPSQRSRDWDSILASRQPPRTSTPDFVDAFLADLEPAGRR